MANPNRPPQTQHEHAPHSNEALLDNQRILAKETTVDVLLSLSAADRQVFDSALKDALGNGDIYGTSPQGDLIVADRIDPVILKDAYWKLCRETTNAPNAKKRVEDGVFHDKTIPAASYSSLVVANIPHPETFLKMMNEKLVADHPNADDQQKADFQIGLDNLSMLLYGSRFQEYEDQLGDLALDKPETERSAIDMRNREQDVLILGNKYRVERTIDAAARKHKDSWATFKAASLNGLSTPKLMWREFHLNRTEKKLARKKDKLAEKRKQATNTSSKLLRQLRNRQADSYENRVVAKHTQKRDDRLTRRDQHKQTMDDRTQGAKDTAQLNAEVYREKIDGYKAKRQAVLAKRALKETLKREHSATRAEVTEILKSLSPEQMQRIGRVACLRESAQRAVKKVEYQHHAAQDRIQSFERALASSKLELDECTQEIPEVTENLSNIDTDRLPTLQNALTDAHHTLTSIDPSAVEYIDAQQTYNRLADELAELQNTRALTQLALTRLLDRRTQIEANKIRLERQLTLEKARATTLDEARGDRQAVYQGRDEAFKRVIDNATIEP